MEEEKGSSLSARAETLVAWVTSFAGGVIGAYVDPSVGAPIGAAVGASAPQIGGLARLLCEGWKSKRIKEGLRMVGEGLADQGATEQDAERLGDILTEAIPLFADAQTEGKLRMIANVILNAAARPDVEAAKAEAMHAADCIRELAAAAALVFAVAARERRERGDKAKIIAPRNESYAGLPRGVVLAAFRQLYQQDLLRAADDGTGPGTAIYFEPLGDWLREWIEHNPPADADAAQAGRQETPAV